MPWKYLLLASLLIVVGSVLVRAWFGKRVIAASGGRVCRVRGERWREVLGERIPVPADPPYATVCGIGVRAAALEQWKKDDPRAARSREAAKRFGLAVPPLTVVVVVFAILVMKLGPLNAIPVVLGATALACVFGLLSTGSELRAVARTMRKVREAYVFPNSEDEDAVAACAAAEVWMQALPPVLRWFV